MDFSLPLSPLFGYGWILPYLWFASTSLMKNVSKLSHFLLPYGLPIFTIVVFALSFYVIKKEGSEIKSLLLYPEKYPEVRYVLKELNGKQIRVVTEDNCWNSEIPCINSNLLSDSLQMRGKDIRQGFKRMNSRKH